VEDDFNRWPGSYCGSVYKLAYVVNNDNVLRLKKNLCG
jgi:hypothetical protein